jgi:hypothetical protein
MTTNASPETLAVTDRIRDELAARDIAATTARELTNMPATTWYRRMRDPSTWTLGELDALAAVLKVSRGRLTG